MNKDTSRLIITLTTGKKSVSINDYDLHGLVQTLGKEERVDACPRCHRRHFKNWLWLGRVMHKCLGCGRIWSFKAPK